MPTIQPIPTFAAGHRLLVRTSRPIIALFLLLLVGCSNGKPSASASQALPSASSLPAPTLAESDKPVILIHRDSHDRIMQPRERLEVAVWSDGRIVWRNDSDLLQGNMDRAKLDGLLQQLHREGVFGEGKAYYGNSGPDSDVEVIEVRTIDRTLRLVSWHDLFEQDSRLVVTSRGVESLEGRNRKSVLAAEPKEYLRFRRIWTDIRSTVRSLMPSEGEPFSGTVPIGERG